MNKRLVECVPNFSEGRDMGIIKEITDAITSVEGIKLLDVDPGQATNRTVVTFVGEPEAVAEAAFRGVKKASEVIDMRHHKGAHPRIGATDVLPIIPVAGITLEECAEIARTLAKRIYDELGIPTYNYEAAAQRPERRNLAVCRKGEYEGLEKRISDPNEAPDFGPGKYTEQAARSGATVVGARDFLIRPPPRQRHRIRRAREGPADARRRFARREAAEGCRRQHDYDTRHTQGHEGHRLVHSRIRRGPGFDEHHRHQTDPAPCGVR